MLREFTAEFREAHKNIGDQALVFAHDTTSPNSPEDLRTFCPVIFPPGFSGLVHVIYSMRNPTWIIYREWFGLHATEHVRREAARLEARAGIAATPLAANLCLLLKHSVLENGLPRTLNSSRTNDAWIVGAREQNPANPAFRRMKLLSEKVEALKVVAGRGKFTEY